MRMPRIKAPPGEDGLYHCMSRIVGGQFLLQDKEKEALVSRMWRLSDFLGVEILDYTVMDNHYHQLLFVPGVIELSNAELLQRLKNYYGENDPHTMRFHRALRQSDAGEIETLRQAYLKRMGDISEYEKTLKQGFSSWYNRRHDRSGTLWMERFNSVLVEDHEVARQTIAGYIDLNAVRASMVKDPKDYRFCTYGAALGGDRRSREALKKVMGKESWAQAAAAYLVLLMGQGSNRAPRKTGAIDRQLLLTTLRQKGELPIHELIRLRVRYFSDGLVLGSELFVEEVFQRYRSQFGKKRKSGARPIRECQQSSLSVIRDLRLKPVS